MPRIIALEAVAALSQQQAPTVTGHEMHRLWEFASLAEVSVLCDLLVSYRSLPIEAEDKKHLEYFCASRARRRDVPGLGAMDKGRQLEIGVCRRT